MRTKKSLNKHSYAFSALFFLGWDFSAFHAKAPYEFALYSMAAAASIFLWVLELSGWRAKKPEVAAGQEEHREGTST